MGVARRTPAMRKLRGASGQMTVEFAVALPVLLTVALVCMNAMLLLGECASFDRLASEAVRTCAASPGYGVDAQAAAAQAQAQLASSFGHDFEQVEVSVGSAGLGHLAYTATLRFTPTLFGRPFDMRLFGLALAPVSHSVRVVIDPYKPGVLL